MAEQPIVAFSGRTRFRLLSLGQLLWAGLSVGLRRIIRGPLLPNWPFVLEATTRYQKMLFRAVYRMANISEGRELLDAVLFPSEGMGLVAIEPVDGPIRGAWYKPPATNVEKIILYFHGAYAFFAGAERGFVADIAHATGLPTFALDYRLTPEYPFPAQREDAIACYDWLLESGHQAEDIIVMGSSAGGNLCLSLLLALRDSGRPLPLLAVCICPWTDIANSGESVDRNDSFDTLERNMLEIGARWFVGEGSPQEAHISPLRADLGGLPPVYLQAGTSELFYDMICDFDARVREFGGKIELDDWKNMNHLFQAYGNRLKEAREAMNRIVEVVQKA